MFDASSFANRSVFVTGHTGFKGSWLCLWLARIGARVTGYALEPPTSPSHFEIAGVEDVLAAHHIADIRDTEALTRAMVAAQPDYVLHLAAQTVVRTGYEEPYETFSVNVMGTASVMEAVRALGKPCNVVVVTSDKCYENKEQSWGYRETDALGDKDPYGGSKGAAELVVRSYRESFFHPDRLSQHGVKVATARAGNVIGGGDWTAHALIVDLARSMTTGLPVEIRSPGAYRPWQHVLQALSGYLTVAARLDRDDDPAVCSAWNIGPLPGNEIPVSEIADLFIEHWGSGDWIDVSRPLQEREAHILRLCIDKALWDLGWTPQWSTREVVARTVDWYRAWHEGDRDMRGVSLAQIEAYESSMRSSAQKKVPELLAA
ncbi:CDP-glucose 4,6-dehydratase [soil metagenome]